MKTFTKMVPIYFLKKFVYRCFLISLISIACLTLFTFYLTNFPKSNPRQVLIRSEIQCYRNSTQETLPDISESEPPPLGKSIFFHETSCNSHIANKIVITARQACAVESAARLNPEYQTYLLYASPGAFKLEENTESDRFLSALLEYKNVKILHLNLEKFINNTPLADLYKKTGAIETSTYSKWHASDILRFLTLWKYGGIHLDLDVIVVKPLEDLGVNYAGLESESSVAAGVLNFGMDNVGRKVAAACLDDLKRNFDGNQWGNNGPGVMTRVLQNMCNEWVPIDMVNSPCEGFTVYPTNHFYSVGWSKWWYFFSKTGVNRILKMTKNSYVVHVWNHSSARLKLGVWMKTPYTTLADKFCPKVFEQVFEYF